MPYRDRTRSYAWSAVFQALESGLTAGELDDVLRGAAPTELVPPRPDEETAEYGCRAASEIMVRYILRDRTDIPPEPLAGATRPGRLP